MRILQVFNPYLNPGGEETSAGRMARHLAIGGHEVGRFWRASSEWRSESAPPKWMQPFLLWRNPAVLRDLRDAHARFKPGAWLLHNVIPVVSLGVYELARELDVPVIQWLHNYRPISVGGALRVGGREFSPTGKRDFWAEVFAGGWRGSRLLSASLALGYKRLEWRRAWESVRAWVAVSGAMEEIFRRAGWFPDRLFSLHHSWDMVARPSEVPPREGTAFLFLGRIVEEKGIRFLVELFRRPALADCELVVAGSGPLEGELRPICPPNVRWVGYVAGEEKRALIRRSRAILFPSLWEEPLSTIAYEAYEQERPILVSDSGGMREIVCDGQTGEVLASGDADAWEKAVLRIKDGWGRADKMGESGRRWLMENVSPKAWNRGFSNILANAIPGIASGGATDLHCHIR